VEKRVISMTVTKIIQIRIYMKSTHGTANKKQAKYQESFSPYSATFEYKTCHPWALHGPMLEKQTVIQLLTICPTSMELRSSLVCSNKPR
jgi:hypothetical protein